MSSTPICEDSHSHRKVRTSTRNRNKSMKYADMDYTITNSSDSDNDSNKKSKVKKQTKHSVKKSNEEIDPIVKFAGYLHNQKTETIRTDNGNKLFPIFSSITCSISQVSSSVSENVNHDEKSSDDSCTGAVTHKEVVSTNGDNVQVDVKGVIAEIGHKRKSKKSKKRVCEVTTNDPDLSGKVAKKKITVKENIKEPCTIPHNETGESEVSAKTNEKVLTKRKHKKSIENKDVPTTSKETSEDQLDKKLVVPKTKSITEFFIKVQNPQTVKSSSPKMFPIFSNSPKREIVTSNCISSPELRVQKKRKIDNLTEPSIFPKEEEADVLESNNTSKALKVTLPDSSQSEVQDATSQITPAKRVRKTSQKVIKTSRTFGAAVLRSCNSKYTYSNDDKLKETLESSCVEPSQSSAEFECDELEKSSRTKLKRNVLRLLPQSHKILKISKNKSKLKVKVKNAAKLFPLFLKSPAVLAKKKSIETMNLLAKKRIEGNVNIEEKNLSKDIETDIISISNTTKDKFIKKRGRPKKVQNLNFSEVEEKFPNESVEIEPISNNSEVCEKVKKKPGRPRKELNSVLLLKGSTKIQELQPNKGEVLTNISKKLESVSSTLPLKSLVEVGNIDLPHESSKVISCDVVPDEKQNSEQQSKPLLKKKSIEENEISAELSSERINAISNSSEVDGNLKRRSLRQRKVISYVSPKKSTIEREEIEIESANKTNNEVKHLKKYKGTSKQLKMTLAADLMDESKKAKKLTLKKSMIEKKNLSKKASINEKDIVEVSDESIEEINESVTIVKMGISKNTDTVKSQGVELSQKVNAHPKKVEQCFPFPLYSHCCQMLASPAVFNDCSSSYILKDEDVSDVSIPAWNNVIGLTELKVIQPALQTKTSKEVLTKTPLSSPSNLEENSDTLWTNIANDYNLKEVVSESTISELTLWLKQWKSKFNKSVKQRPDRDDSFDSFSCDSYDSDGDGLSNSVILMGPPGSGKTSLVFSLANELGFKVLEVNASSCRSGRNISHQLKEALESYHVENIKAADIKEKEVDIFSAPSSKSSKVVASKKQANKGIASFFKKDSDVKEENQTTSVKNFFQPKSSSSAKPLKQKSKLIDKKSNQSNYPNKEASKESNPCSISSHTIILFDDIDVVFQEDEGFWSTIRGFLKISKKPVIFTVSRNLEIVKDNLDIDIKILRLKPMIQEVALQKLKDQFKKYGAENKSLNIELLTANSNDVRRNLLHAQFWSQLTINSSEHLNEKYLSTNTFSLSSLESTDFKHFLSDQPLSNSCNIISDYHQIGYDILHTNLFSMFNVTNDRKAEREWQNVTKRSEEDSQSEKDAKSVPANCTLKSDLWEEACKIFEFKKRALQNGSSSSDLFLFSNILEDNSFIDVLKGDFCKSTNWVSLSERLKKWSLGWPMCNDNDIACHSDLTLDLGSLVQVLRLKKEYNTYFKQHDLVHDKTALLLEHSFPNFDYANGHVTQEQADVISAAVPANLTLCKSVLNLDYLSTLKIMCQDELLRQTRTGKRSNRFLHYFDSISLLLDKQEIELILQE